MIMDHARMEKTPSNPVFSTKNSKWNTPKLNSGPQNEGPVTYRLSHGTAIV
jgi:hypothetical protein